MVKMTAEKMRRIGQWSYAITQIIFLVLGVILIIAGIVGMFFGILPFSIGAGVAVMGLVFKYWKNYPTENF